MTPCEVAERMIADTPRMFEHRSGGKRASEQTGEQTLRQIRWAAALLEKSLPKGTPFWRVTPEDLKSFDRALDKLPITCGKSPIDREPGTRLEDIIARAEQALEDGDIQADEIGLTTATSNKHYRKLAQLHDHLRERVPQINELPFSSYIQPDCKDERQARLRYTIEQGKAIFSLPPWTGCRSVNDRLSKGCEIFHDSLYFVLILVWYTGARREEICKLRTQDVDCVGDIWFLRIENTETGRVKNNWSQRTVARHAAGRRQIGNGRPQIAVASVKRCGAVQHRFPAVIIVGGLGAGQTVRP